MSHAVSYITFAVPPIHCPTPSPTPSRELQQRRFLNPRPQHACLCAFGTFSAMCRHERSVFFYICLLWHAANNQPENIPLPVKALTRKGLSSSELEKLPKVTGKELVLGTECAVCLDDIESEQLARIVPGCNHGFHLECADTWLSKHPVCPVCRAKLDALFFSASASPENSPC
ncbi:RING-H2 FINGER PROTEIN ATL61-RELATED-RELATED [Salix koriyanagi]|uniref:RING-H2 FINGER PROTEIN ATL61-RELATED-RELATED n=1 Tax=Salix koriyanagi TaxID=2511006 RepID=A0A9Q0QL02_9ROSI|nr:RING-H2 FINGER PROTEIN ATL61-RELATED-RELATED [Salix koriyanagi]